MRLTDRMTVTFARRGVKAKSFSVPPTVARKLQAMIASSVRPVKKQRKIPVEQVLPDLADDALHCAAILRGARYKAGMTQRELAALLDIHQHHLSEMEHAKRPVGKQMARRLARVLACDYRLFI